MCISIHMKRICSDVEFRSVNRELICKQTMSTPGTTQARLRSRACDVDVKKCCTSRKRVCRRLSPVVPGRPFVPAAKAARCCCSKSPRSCRLNSKISTEIVIKCGRRNCAACFNKSIDVLVARSSIDLLEYVHIHQMVCVTGIDNPDLAARTNLWPTHKVGSFKKIKAEKATHKRSI
jgi:hypothetical protein